MLYQVNAGPYLSDWDIGDCISSYEEDAQLINCDATNRIPPNKCEALRRLVEYAVEIEVNLWAAGEDDRYGAIPDDDIVVDDNYFWTVNYPDMWNDDPERPWDISVTISRRCSFNIDMPENMPSEDIKKWIYNNSSITPHMGITLSLAKESDEHNSVFGPWS